MSTIIQSEALLLLLFGLPGSGKTTLVHYLSELLPCSIISYDDIASEWTSPSSDVLDKPTEAFKAARRRTLGRVDDMVMGTKGKGEVIIVDDNMFYRSMRREIFLLCCKHTIIYLQLYLECTIGTALKRCNARKTHRIPEVVVNRMAERFEYPMKGEEWEKNATIVWNADIELNSERLKDLVALIYNRWSSALKARHISIQYAHKQELSRLASSTSPLQVLNVRLTNSVSFAVNQAEKTRRGEIGRIASNIKKEIMEKARVALSQNGNAEELVNNFVETFENRVREIA